MRRGMEWRRQEICFDCGSKETLREWIARLPQDWRRRNEEIPRSEFAEFIEQSLLDELRPKSSMRDFITVGKSILSVEIVDTPGETIKEETDG